VSIRRNSTRITGTLSDVRVPLTVPKSLATELSRLAERDCSSVSALARRLIAHAVQRELAALEAQ